MRNLAFLSLTLILASACSNTAIDTSVSESTDSLYFAGNATVTNPSGETIGTRTLKVVMSQRLDTLAGWWQFIGDTTDVGPGVNFSGIPHPDTSTGYIASYLQVWPLAMSFEDAIAAHLVSVGSNRSIALSKNRDTATLAAFGSHRGDTSYVTHWRAMCTKK